MFIRKFLGAVALTGLLSACGAKTDASPAPTPAPAPQPITVNVSEAGAPSYPLRDAAVVSSNYQTGVSALTITGKLNSGKVLTLNFSRSSGNPPPYTTNGLEATLDGVAGSAASGTTTFSPTTRKVDGAFAVTFPATGGLSGSFTGVPLP